MSKLCLKPFGNPAEGLDLPDFKPEDQDGLLVSLAIDVSEVANAAARPFGKPQPGPTKVHVLAVLRPYDLADELEKGRAIAVHGRVVEADEFGAPKEE